MIPYDLERRIALTAVTVASRLARRLQTTLITGGAISKSDASPVTVADYAVQAMVVHRLQAKFPKDRFIAEETSVQLREDDELLTLVASAVSLPPAKVLSAIDACSFNGGDSGRTWILDPIDGTRGFIDFRQYCIALALLDKGIVRLGVLGCPSLPLDSMSASLNSPFGCLFHAVRNDGTYMIGDADLPDYDEGILPDQSVEAIPLGDRVKVSDVADPMWSTFCESVETGHSSHELSARVAAILGVSTPPVRMDSQAKYGCMARGDASIFLRFPRKGYIENVWDSAPAAIVVEEAGGRVTDGRGRKLDFSLGRKMDNDDGIVATNGTIHDAVIDAVQQAMRESREDAR